MAHQPLLPFGRPDDSPNSSHSARDIGEPKSVGEILHGQVLPTLSQRMTGTNSSLQVDLGTLLDDKCAVGNQFSRKEGRHGALLRICDELRKDPTLLSDRGVIAVLESCARSDKELTIRENLIRELGSLRLNDTALRIVKIGVEASIDRNGTNYNPNHASRVIDLVMGIGQSEQKRSIIAEMFTGLFERNLKELVRTKLDTGEGKVGDRYVAALTEWRSESLNAMLGDIVRSGTKVNPLIVARACLAASPGPGSFGREDLRPNLLSLLDHKNQSIVSAARQALVWFYPNFVREFQKQSPNSMSGEIPALKRYVSAKLGE